MIEIGKENLITLKDAADLLPRRRRGKKPSFTCLWRWAEKGVRGVKLDVIRVGATLCTSHEALQRFCNALTEKDGFTHNTALRTPARRDKALRDAQEILKREGVL